MKLIFVYEHECYMPGKPDFDNVVYMSFYDLPGMTDDHVFFHSRKETKDKKSELLVTFYDFWSHLNAKIV